MLPRVSTRPIDLKLKDGKILRIREFWALFLFDEIFIDNCYESPEILALGPFETIIDIGANIGFFTVRAKQLWPQARIVSLEPHPTNFEHLREHIELNHLTGVQPLNVGVAEKCGCLDLYLSPRNIGGHSMYKKEGEAKISVPIISLADVLTRTNSNGTGLLLKIDCEGCEHAILSNLTQDMADRVACIIFEPERSLYDLKDLLDKLEQLGFETTEFGELVVASRLPAKANASRSVGVR
jgi:FkbM family methyltransferase